MNGFRVNQMTSEAKRLCLSFVCHQIDGNQKRLISHSTLTDAWWILRKRHVATHSKSHIGLSWTLVSVFSIDEQNMHIIWLGANNQSKWYTNIGLATKKSEKNQFWHEFKQAKPGRFGWCVWYFWLSFQSNRYELHLIIYTKKAKNMGYLSINFRAYNMEFSSYKKLWEQLTLRLSLFNVQSF